MGSSEEDLIGAVLFRRKDKIPTTIGIARKINPLQSRVKPKIQSYPGRSGNGPSIITSVLIQILIRPGTPHRSMAAIVNPIARFRFSILIS
jgi:hypothetical protein